MQCIAGHCKGVTLFHPTLPLCPNPPYPFPSLATSLARPFFTNAEGGLAARVYVIAPPEAAARPVSTLFTFLKKKHAPCHLSAAC